jgi:hypothetical protein
VAQFDFELYSRGYSLSHALSNVLECEFFKKWMLLSERLLMILPFLRVKTVSRP